MTFSWVIPFAAAAWSPVIRVSRRNSIPFTTCSGPIPVGVLMESPFPLAPRPTSLESHRRARAFRRGTRGTAHPPNVREEGEQRWCHSPDEDRGKRRRGLARSPTHLAVYRGTAARYTRYTLLPRPAPAGTGEAPSWPARYTRYRVDQTPFWSALIASSCR